MKKVAIQFDEATGKITIDLGGDHDLGCCGCAAKEIEEELTKLGIKLNFCAVYCRLPVVERVRAKLSGECNMDPLKKRARLKNKKIVHE